jgi:hypothetical protein
MSNPSDGGDGPESKQSDAVKERLLAFIGFEVRRERDVDRIQWYFLCSLSVKRADGVGSLRRAARASPPGIY